MVTVDIMKSTSIHLLSMSSHLNLLRAGCFLYYLNITSMWGLLGFLLLDSSVQARRSTVCLSIPNCFPLRRRIACTLSTHHELKYTMFNMSVAFLTLTIVIERPFFVWQRILQLTIALLCSVRQNAPYNQFP